MAKLYYGNGNCSIEGADIRGVEIRYKGAIEIDDKTSDSFAIAHGHHKNRILVLPIGLGFLNDLFDYEGYFKILSVAVANNNSEKVTTTIHRVMDYTELLTTNSEDMTTKSEDLSSTYLVGKRVAKTILKQQHINNQHTSKNIKVYLKDGTLYEGYFHIHLFDKAAMTGKEHTETSQDLYLSTGKPTRNTSLVPDGLVEQAKKIKAERLKSRRLKRKMKKPVKPTRNR